MGLNPTRSTNFKKMFDLEDSDSFDFSVLDRAKIEDLEMDEKVESESGAFAVARLRNGFHVWVVKGDKTGVFRFPTLEKVFEFLDDN